MALIYKTLFEVKFMHEFYLTDSKGESVFDFADQSARINFLLSKFVQNRASVNDDLTYQVPPALQTTFDDYHLKLLPTYSGFRIVGEVTAKILTDGTLVYTPKIKIPENLNIVVSLLKKNRLFDSLSNMSMNKALSAIYYFTNENIIHSRTFPFLNSAITPFDVTASYEQGELASYGLNDTRQFYNDGTSDQWSVVKGNHFANKADLLVITPLFNYDLNSTENITEARFILKDSNGVIVRKYEIKGADTLNKVNINLNPAYKEEPLTQLPLQDVTEKSIYTLEVLLNNTIERKHTVLFWNSDFEFKNYWGVINIKPQVNDINFKLLDNDGFLKTRKFSTGTWQAPPVFEIAIKSRLAYWRYKNDKFRKLSISDDITDFVESLDNNLVLKKPRSLTYIPTQFKAIDTTYHHLPNPISYENISKINKKMFLDILVSESKMFPSAPG